MKAKKVFGLTAFASACVSLSAFANVTNDWFVADASAEPALVNVTTGGTVTVENQKFVLDSESPLTFTPDVLLTATNSTNIARIDVRAVLTPSLTNEFQQTVGEAKAGFAVGIDAESNTNFYGYVAGGGWEKFNDGTPRQDDAETSFSIVLNYRDGEARFMVDDVEIGSRHFTPGGTLSRLEAFGAGSISSITSGYELAICSYEDKPYGSVAEAKVAGGTEADINDVNPDGTIPTQMVEPACGLSLAVCKALGLPTDDANANIAVAPAATDDDVSHITLAVNVDGAPEASAVRYKVESSGAPTQYYTDAAAIKIPLAAGTYTITPELN